MPVIQRTRASLADYNEIWDYFAAHDVSAADRLVDRFDETLRTIATAPLIGKKAEEFANGLRSFPVGNYVIFYRPIKEGIQLIRILHGARNIALDYFI